MSGSSALPKHRYQTLDGLRGIAAAAVVVHHARHWFPQTPHLAESAVDLFFLISGFVLASAYGERLQRDLSPRRFMVLRLIRLYPLYLAGLLIAALGLLASLYTNRGLTEFHTAFWKAIPFASLMLPSPSFGIMGNAFPLNPPAWSLFYELLINLLFCLTYRFWNRLAILTVAALCGAWIFLDPTILSGGWNHETFLDGILRVAFFFPLGVLLYHYEDRLPCPGWLRPWHCLALFAALIWIDPGPLHATLILLGYPLLVACSAKVEPTGIWLATCKKLGQWSYAMYAVHFPIIGLASAAQAKLGSLHWTILGLGLLIGLPLVCEGLDRLYDAPLRRYLTRFLPT